MHIRVIQQTPSPRQIAANIESAAAAVRDAPDADLVVLPELFLSGYQLERLDAIALSSTGAALDAIRHAAATAQTAVIAGFVEARHGQFANSAICIGRDGRTCGVYRKTHLFGRERDAFSAGDSLEPISIDGRRVGLMICFDVEFPEVARTLAGKDAALLVTIAANMTPYARDHAVFVEARALENGLPHIYANRTGQESGFTFVGGSRAIDETGSVAGELDQTPSALDIEIGNPRARAHLAYCEQLRPDLYGHGNCRASVI